MIKTLTLLCAVALLFGCGRPPEQVSLRESAEAQKTIATDGSLASVQSAVASAVNGDTITMPAGTFAWNGALNIDKGITLKGAGQGATNITSTFSGGQVVTVNCVPNFTTTIRDFSINGPLSVGNAFFLVAGNGANQFRFTGITVNNSTKWTIWVNTSNTGGSGTGPYGLIDHCTFNTAQGMFIRDKQLATPTSWDRPMTFGTANAVYIEDCIFNVVSMYPNAQVALDGDDGCRVVFRRNTLQDMCVGTHGADSAGPVNSALQHEVMHNTFTVTNGVAQDFCIQFRGGTGVVFDNTVNRVGNGEYNSLLVLQYYRSIAGNGVCPQDRFYPGDYVGTQQPGSGYRSPGQDPKSPGKPWGTVPIYVWGNHINAPLNFGTIGVKQGSGFMAANRDYFDGPTMPGYTEFTYPHPLQGGGGSSPSPTPVQSPTPTATVAPSPSPSPTATSTATATSTSTATATATATATTTPPPAATPQPSPTTTVTPSASPTPTPYQVIVQPGQQVIIEVRPLGGPMHEN